MTQRFHSMDGFPLKKTPGPLSRYLWISGDSVLWAYLQASGHLVDREVFFRTHGPRILLTGEGN